jgi:hypothetical protein
MFSARQVHFEMLATFLAFMTGAWGPRPTPTVLTRSAFVTAAEPRERDDVQVPKVYDFGMMTKEEAGRLEGKRIWVRVVLREEPRTYERHLMYWALGDSKVLRTVHFKDIDASSAAPNHPLIVEGRMLVGTILNSAVAGTSHNLQLLDAKIIKP